MQSVSFATYCALHFHNGRSIAGFRLLQMRAAARLARLGSCAILPAFLIARTLRVVLGKGRFVDRALLGLPFIACFSCCHAAGELLGYLTGPGKSPRYPHIG